MTLRLLVYYFGFPHYRQEILSELTRSEDALVTLVSGSSTKGGLRTLSETDLPGLRRTRTLKLGPFTWDKGIHSLASARGVDVAVLGPAVSSLTTWMILVHRRIRRRRTFLWGRFGNPAEVSPKRLLLEGMSRLATGLLVYGHRDLEVATSMGLDEERVTIVGNAIESNSRLWSKENGVQAYRRMRQAVETAKRDGTLVLAHSGRLTPSKRPEVLLDAVGILKARFPNVHLHLVGEGPALEDLRNHQHASNVSFHGPVYDGEKVIEILRSAALVVSPLNMGLLAIDALRAGVPVLIPDHRTSGPEVEALTVGVNAQEFRAGDPEALAAEAIRWIENAGLITESEYVSARSAALRFWDPAQVASAIIGSIKTLA